MKKDSAPKNVESIKDGAVLKESEIADVVFPDGTHLVTAGDTDIVRLSCGGIDVHKKILTPYFANKYNAIKRRRGHKKAIIAIVRRMIVAIYHMLSEGTTFQPNDLDKTLKSSGKKVELTVDNTCDYLKSLGVSDDILAQIKGQCGTNVGSSAIQTDSDNQNSR